MTVTRMAGAGPQKRGQLRGTWTPTIPVTVHIFASAGLAVRGPHHGGGGGSGVLSTRDTTPYVWFRV